MQDGHLVLIGDDASNAIIIERVSDDDRTVVRVRAIGGTTINGQPMSVFSGVKGIWISLAGGDDAVTFSNVRIRGSVEVRAGSGDDQILVGRSRINGSVNVADEDGSDAFYFRDSTVQRDVRLSGGRSNDRYLISRLHIKGGFELNDRWGPTIASITALSVDGATRCDTGHSIDRIRISDSDFDDVAKFQMRGRNDLLSIRGTEFTIPPLIDAGPGADSVLRELYFKWDFASGSQGWRAGFADYRESLIGSAEDPLAHYEMEQGVRAAPEEVGKGRTAYRLSGNNGSDDLFMFLSRALVSSDGIIPRTRYTVKFDLTMASDAPAGIGGIGGSPGESVYLKVGGIGEKPTVTRSPGSTLFALNVNKGGNGEVMEGGDLSIAGDIVNGGPPLADHTYRIIHRSHVHPSPIRADARGKIWLVVGTDSGFEGRTTLYYMSIVVRMMPTSIITG